MSFINWNLSSDEENGFDDWANVDLQESLQQQNRKFANHNDDGESSEDEIQNRNAIATVAFLSEDYPVEENDDEEEEEEEDEVDWEDAVEENNVDDDSKLPADNTALGNLKPVTLDMNEKPKTENKKRERNKATARRKFRFESLSPSLQRFLSNLERAYLLSCTGHTMYASKYCSGDEPLHVAHSLIPSAWINVSLNGDPEDCAPTKKDLSHFCNVFFDLVNRGRQTPRWTVRPRAGKSKKTESGKRNIESKVNQSEIRYRTKDYCSYLSRNHEQDAQQRDNSEGKDFNEHDRVHLLVSMAR